MDSRWTRRRFLSRALGASGGAAALPYLLGRAAAGAETGPAAGERLALGMIGLGGMGSAHLQGLLGMADVRIVAVADVYQPHRDRAVAQIGPGCRGYNDYRELLARPDIDAVVIATPDHWHAAAAVDACQAGKDVYCEKPLSKTIREAEAMVQAARRYGTVFQVGSQQRSSPEHFRLACELVRSGRIGKLQWMKTRLGRQPTCGWEANEPPPAGLDWDFWLGPAPWAEYTPKRCLGDFRWFYDYAGGMMTDWGAHHNDIAQWANNSDGSGPVRIEPVSVEFPTSGLFDTAARFEVKYTYANGVVLYCTDEGNDVELHGSAGWIFVNRERITASDPEILREPLGAGDVHLEVSTNHMRNWMDCIRSRRRPICDVAIGASSVTVCHLGNIALRTGRVLEWDPQKHEITNDPHLERWLSVPYRGTWRLG